MRSLPWVKEVQEKYQERGLQIVGIHTPEFAWEKKPEAVQENLRKHGLTYPNMMDNDFAYWKRLNNRYWPTVYLADREGRIRYVHIGETHSGSPEAQKVEGLIESLLEESVEDR